MAETSLKDKKSVSPDLDTELVGNERGLIMVETNSKDEMVSNAGPQRLSTLLDLNCSRPDTMFRMALGGDASRLNLQDRLWHKQRFTTFILA